MTDAAKMICIICECRLVNESAPRTRNKDVKALKCGHLFHRGCIDSWLKQKCECPIDRQCIDPERDVVDKLFFNEREYNVESDEEDQPGTSQDVPWYEKYKEGLLVAGGAVLGGILTATLMASRKKKDRKN